MSEFFVGQKVVCVDDSPRDYIASPLKKGATYTITYFQRDNEDEFCLVAEAIPPELYFWFDALRFRPFEEKPDSIELFREIARGVSDGKPIVEDAEYRLPTPEKVRA